MDGTGGRWRTVVSAVCIALAGILLPVSIVGAWARVQLVDEDAFIATFAPLVDDADVQQLIIDETNSAIRAQVDFAALTDELFDGIIDLGLPARASAALELLRVPAADGVAGLVDAAVAKVVVSDAFSGVWHTMVQGAHQVFTFASTADGGVLIVRDAEGDGVSLALGPVVAAVKTGMLEQGIGVATLIPTVTRTVPIGSVEGLVTVQRAHSLTAAAGWWTPVATAVLFGIGIAFARRRAIAILGTGIAVALGAGLLGVALTVVSPLVAAVGVELGLAPAGLTAIYAQLIGAMRLTAWGVAAVGFMIAIGGWFLHRQTGTVLAAGSADTSAESAADNEEVHSVETEIVEVVR